MYERPSYSQFKSASNMDVFKGTFETSAPGMLTLCFAELCRYTK